MQALFPADTKKSMLALAGAAGEKAPPEIRRR
jgi:hypothetical protein